MKCRYVNDWGDECGDDALDFGWCPFHLKQMYGKPELIGVVERRFSHETGPYFVDSEAASVKQVGGNHYKDMAIQPSEFIYRNNLNWLQGNAIKYICRHNRKHGAQDLDKAIHYLELLKEWEYERDGPEGD